VKIIISVIDITAYVLLTIATLIMVVSIFLQVIFRYVIGNPLFWSEEISRYAFVWIVFIGAALATKRGSHIGVDYFISRLAERSKKIIALCVGILVLTFIVVVIINSFPLISSNMTQKSPAVRITMGYVFLAIPIGFTMMFIYTFEILLKMVIQTGVLIKPGRIQK
jgi:TRAP-type transport system small permease protein